MEPIGDLHIDDFCKDVSRILILLYKRFPNKTTLYVEDICGPDQPDEFGLHSARFESCFSTMLWMKETDYIMFSHTVRQEAVEEAVLSHRSFTFLSSIEENPEFIENNAEQNTIFPSGALIRRIDYLKYQLKAGTSETLKNTVLNYFGQSRRFS